jgi:phospholipid/cholesterol/gamma-HCH transport system substrate-binding protein
MAVGTNQWKLGLFVLVGLAIAVAVIVTLGAGQLTKETASYATYFDESVQGLDVGSPVKYRGVTIGRVGAIDIAPDHRHVRVTCEIGVDELTEFELNKPEDRAGMVRAPTLRAQLGSMGLTGVKFVLLDYFSVERAESPALPFEAGANVIPSVPSMLKNLEQSMDETADQVPAVAAAVQVTLDKANSFLDHATNIAVQVETEQLPSRLSATLDRTDQTLREIQTQMQGLDAPGVSAKLQADLVELHRTLSSANAVLDRVAQDEGLLSNAEGAAEQMREMIRNAHSLTPQLDGTLRDVSGAARSIRRFADALERDPDMLLKGRGER